jgi:hypothetical protein
MQALVVHNDYDVVVMRQDVRQHARSLGLGLIQQAKIATAISAVARGTLALQQFATFSMQTAKRGSRQAFEILCVAPLATSIEIQSELEQALHVPEARLLVDEIELVMEKSALRLTLRVWITNAIE